MPTSLAPVPSAVADCARLAALRRISLPGVHAEAFDRLARLAAGFLGAPVTLVALVEPDRQVLVGAWGLPEPFASRREDPSSLSYCRDLLEAGEPLIIEDAREDARFREHAALLEFGVVAYLGIPIRSAEGHVLGTFCALDHVPRRWSAQQIELLADLTASAMTEIELRQEMLERAAAEQRATQILESITDAFYTLDTEWRFSYVNHEAEHLLRHSRDELLGTSLWQAFPDIVDTLFERQYRQAVAEGVAAAFEAYYPPPLDSWYAVHAYPSAEGLSVYFHAINERKLAEARLLDSERHRRQAERLASVGAMIGGVAHELNNPLHAILNFSQLMLLDERSVEDQEALDIIAREAERMAKIVSDLKQMAQSTQDEDVEPSAVDLNEIVRHVLKVQEYRLRTSNIEVREDLAGDLPKVLADGAQLEQVIMNLVINAEQAMTAHAGRGRLILRTRASARGTVLHVVDTGHGIPAHEMARIFDPFYTTKSPGEGMGLGLSLVRNIITEHGGEVHVDSEVGNGTAFRIELPSAPDGHAEEAALRPEPPRPRKGLRVLIVEDEASIRAVVARYLERRGHGVDQAAEGAAALAMLDRSAYDVIISDLRMPGLDGEAMLEHLAARGLASRVVFITGDAAGAGERLRLTGVPILHKPAKLDEVCRVVEEAGRRIP